MRRRIVLVLLSLNLAYIALFFTWFFAASKRFDATSYEYDLARPAYIIANKSLSSYDELKGALFRSFRIVEAPACWAVRPVVWVINKNPASWYTTYAGTSPLGYLLMAQSGLSFFQWLLIGIALDRFFTAPVGRTE